MFLDMDIDTVYSRGYVALDIETTGLSPAFCSIVEIAALKKRADGSLEEFQTLVNPGCHISERSTAIHGIKDEMVKDAPSDIQSVMRLAEFVGEMPLVLHNAPFDMSFLNPVLSAQGRIWKSCAVFDTLPLSKKAFPGLKKYNLEQLSRFFDFDHGNHHRALDDCDYCMRLFELILEKFNARMTPFDEFKEAFAASDNLLR